MTTTRKKTVRHNFTILCDQVILDKADRPSIIGAIRNLVFDVLPGDVPRLAILVSFTASPGQKYFVAIEDPRRKELVRFDDQDVLSPSAHADGRATHMIFETYFVANVQNARFETEGIHHVVVRVGGRTIRREPFGVSLRRSRRTKE